MCVYIYIYIYIYVYPSLSLYIYIYTHIFVYLFMCMTLACGPARPPGCLAARYGQSPIGSSIYAIICDKVR